MQKRILLIGTLDSKTEEYIFARDLILKRGHEVLLIDVGILEDSPIKATISAAEIADIGGCSLDKLRAESDRGKAVEIMSDGLRILIPRLFHEGKFDGVLSFGGGTGTNIATAGMRELPVGVPKIMVSSVASADINPYVDIKDITMMFSVVDIAGLNRLSRRIISNAVGGICGMVEQEISTFEDKPLIAASMFGVTTPCVNRVRLKLEQAGYETVIFHATGTGGRAMEGLIQDGFFNGVVDITTTEWCDEVAGGVISAGPDRLSAAGKAGIPQVVSCGALDIVNFHAFETVPEKCKNRTLHRHNPNVTLMRTNPKECEEIGRRIAEQLNKAAGPVVLILPLQGLSAIDKPGKPFYSPEANQALFDSLHKHIKKDIPIIDEDAHINDPEFADLIAEQLLKLINNKSDIRN